MSKAVEPEKSINRRVEFVGEAEVPTLYVNNVNIDGSTFDVRIRLGQIDRIDGDVVKVREKMYVYMSHSHAKAFAAALQTIIGKVDELDKAGGVETS